MEALEELKTTLSFLSFLCKTKCSENGFVENSLKLIWRFYNFYASYHFEELNKLPKIYEIFVINSNFSFSITNFCVVYILSLFPHQALTHLKKSEIIRRNLHIEQALFFQTPLICHRVVFTPWIGFSTARATLPTAIHLECETTEQSMGPKRFRVAGWGHAGYQPSRIRTTTAWRKMWYLRP